MMIVESERPHIWLRHSTSADIAGQHTAVPNWCNGSVRTIRGSQRTVTASIRARYQPVAVIR